MLTQLPNWQSKKNQTIFKPKGCLSVFDIRVGEKVCVSVFEMLKRLLKIGYQTGPTV